MRLIGPGRSKVLPARQPVALAPKVGLYGTVIPVEICARQDMQDRGRRMEFSVGVGIHRVHAVYSGVWIALIVYLQIPK